ncbi:Bifunctional trehalose-6-phosphate synthase/phosphatase [Armadillidium nasatum]|uniref:Bifunctional trehalose-6-phosphate synthase/phosphatase n=1 Tax=Armadillidium nasatum TaxID=96803 RepID=A0A5N5TLI4_9CRUS|nr:Bifunctional trehalose-6-phosphate synthase/phosphatase [Armadillidium nasatum]
MPIRSTSPMVVVSNRLPFTLAKNAETGKLERKISAGGLVTAVAPVVVEAGGLWVGWPGIYSENGLIEIPEADPNDQSPTAGLKTSQVIAVDLKKEMFDKYYNGCCNACFWPLFHSMPDRAIFEGDKWEAYKIVNEEFARLTVQAIRQLKDKFPNSIPLVWIHDYHLMVAANHIRDMCDEEGLRVKMAFFLHIPFPSWDIMRLFPWEDELLQGILGCDSIGFHVEDYCLNFVDCCKRRLGCRVDRDKMLVEHNNRTVEINPLPISIPYERFMKLAEEAKSVLEVDDNKQLLLGVDRLDYTKGLVHRIKAFEHLLEKYPEHKENVIFFQVAVPSRTDVLVYQELKEELDQLIGSVNGKFSTPNWSPIRYIYGCVSQDQLAGFYRDASVAVVTPLRDGMNLVAKEFVACQTQEPGVLVLSPFAGSAESMREALLVNPYETNEFADILHRALTLPKDEREVRMIKLRNRERTHDVNYWLRCFLKSVECLEDENKTISHLAPIGEEDFGQFLSKYVTESTNLAILLDYDGTLAPLQSHPDLAVLPSETKAVLQRLANLPDVHVAIISGRSVTNVKEMVGIEGVTYAGNHGLEIIHPDGTVFTPTIPHDYEVRLKDLKEKLKDSCKHGAWVEDKGSVITYHYIQVPKEDLNDVLPSARLAFKNSGIKLNQSHNAFEARPCINWDKGRAAIHILRTLFGVDWSDRVSTIFAGDDTTDEDAIQALQGMAITFRITQSKNVKTAATHRLPNVNAVFKMLKWIARRLEKREASLVNPR